MPFIDSKVNIKITQDQERQIKDQLGKAIEIIPGKSESWLMVGFQSDYHLYFKGDNSSPTAFIEVSLLGNENGTAFDKLTGQISKIYKEILGIQSDHIYVKYTTTSQWGWNGNNF